MDRQTPPKGDYRKPLPRQKELPPLPFLPEREWLIGRINKVEYEYVYFKGQLQYLTNQKTQEPILDENGEQIPRRQFNIEIVCNSFNLPNGEPRKAWVKLGASMGTRANLPKFLSNMGMEIAEGEEMTPEVIIDYLTGKDVKFQMATKQGTNGEYQQVVWDAVKQSF